MRTAFIILLALVAYTSASAQYTAKPDATTAYGIAQPVPARYNTPAPPTPAEPTPGLLLAQSGRLKNMSLFTAIIFGGLAAGLSTIEDTSPNTTGLLLGIGGVLSLSFNIAGNSKQVKAGKLMQQH